jgi:hypothetical protein
MADAPIYCTHKELKRVFPQLDEYDGKTPLFNFTLQESGEGYASSPYLHPNSGLVTELYRDGNDLGSGKQTIGAAATTLVNEADITVGETEIDVDSGAACTTESYIKIDDEIMYISSISTNTLTCIRGRLGTSAETHANDTSVFQHFNPSADGQWLYDSDNDFVIMSATSNPSDNLMETGEDFATMVTQFRTDASRYLDSRLDPKLPKSQWKNSEGEFDYIIVRTTALIATAFMVRTNNPTSEVLESIELEYEKNIELLNTGRASLGFQNTGDASMGIIRDVTYTAGKLRPVDLKGRAGSVDFDLIKVKVIAGGVLGTGTYSVWIKDSDQLKNNQVITAEKITGDYQPLAYGLQIRFGGESDLDQVAVGDEWEVEVRGVNEKVDASDLTGISMTRRRGV